MSSKLFLVLASLCVVNAAVITNNVFDDKVSDIPEPVESLESLSERGCNYRECDQRCRRLKFPGGVCVNGRCKCDNFLKTEDEVSETLEAHSESVGILSESGCNYRECGQHCRRLGYRGGACVHGHCKCNDFLTTEVSDTLGALSESVEILSERSCNYRECDQRCRRLKFPGGACVNGRCKCDNFLNTEDEISEKSGVVSESAEILSERHCNYRECGQRCRRLGYRGGACVNGHCKCDNFQKSEDVMNNSGQTCHCNFRQCARRCRLFGYEGGTCVNGRCKCHGRRNEEGKVAETSVFAGELTETQRDCNYGACDQQCRRLGFPGGACVNGRCKCDNFLKEDDPSAVYDTTVFEPEENELILKTDEDEVSLPSDRACNTPTCNDMCHRLNYAGGLCQGGVCKCY